MCRVKRPSANVGRSALWGEGAKDHNFAVKGGRVRLIGKRCLEVVGGGLSQGETGGRSADPKVGLKKEVAASMRGYNNNLSRGDDIRRRRHKICLVG